MSTSFYTKKLSKKKLSKLSKRILGMESLENRELLSINPLGIDDNPVPDFVQTANTTVSRDFTDPSNTGASGNTYTDAAALRVATARAAAFAGRDIVTPLAAATNPVYAVAVTDSIGTSSGVTTDQVTITWGKPTKFVTSGDPNNGWKAALSKGAKYSINIFDSSDVFIRTIDSGTKTSYTITGLSSDTDYKFTVTTDLTLTNPADKTASAVNKTDAVVTAGEFKTLATGNAADVTVGVPTDVKATYVKASGTKPAGVKITWKPPANYTGGYKVTLSEGTNTVTCTVNPGSKPELTLKVGDTFDAGSGNISDVVLAKNTRVKIVVTAMATNSIESTPTFVNTGTIAAASIVAPAEPSVPTTAALANTPGGTTVTLNANSTETTNKTAGFYVGVTKIGTSAPDKANVVFINLLYVPKSATTTVNLKAASGDFIYAFAVGTDGTISDTASISAAAADITAEAAATDTTNAYPATKDVKGVTVTADTTAKNKSIVKWTEASDHFSGTAAASAPTAANDFKYEVTGYLVTATIKNGTSAGLSEVQYIAKGTHEAVFSNLRWNSKYDFKVEALVTYTTAQDATTWKTTGTASVSTGGTKAGVMIAKAPTVSEDITNITPVANSNTGTNVTLKLDGAKDGTNYIVTVTDSNKSVLYSGTITGSAAGTTFDFNTNGLTLTPKAKYTVTAQTVGLIPGTVSKGKTATIIATDFISGVLKDAKGTTINSVKINVSAPSKGAGSGDTYYIEYTNIVDAKGKADWNAAQVWLGTDYTGDPETAKGDIQIGKLAPNSQYFFRVVTTDVAYNGGWSDVKKVVASKELKIKTATMPQATIAKNGFTLDSNAALGMKLVGNSMERVDGMAASAKQVLGSLKPANAGDPLYVYTLIASVDNKIDKATGKLVGSENVTNAAVTVDAAKTSATDKKVTDLTGTATFTDIFSTLKINDTNFSSVKGLNLQIQIDIYYGATDNGTAASPGANSDHFTLYSKATKVALPKWFV